MTQKEFLLNVINDIKKNFTSSFVNKILEVSSNDYVFYFSKNKDSGLFLSINNNDPFASLVNSRYSFSLSSLFLNKLKTKLLNSYLLDAHLLNDDNILALEFIKTTDTYDKIHYTFVFEIFKANSNLIILEEGKIVEAFRTRGLEAKHPILIGSTYIPPQKNIIEREFKTEDRQKILNYLDKIEENYLKEKYITILSSLKRKGKTLHNKIEKLNQTKIQNEKELIFKDYGDILISNLSEFKKGDSEFNYEGIKIPLKTDFTPIENSQYYYKQYKKAKTSLSMIDNYIKETKLDLEYIENILTSSQFYNESDYLELIEDLKSRNFIKFRIKIPANLKKNPAKPYYFFYNRVKIGFGKNAKQNNELTFKIAKKSDKFLHVQNYSGSHIVIFDEDPSDDVINFACELAIYLSKNEDGDVIYTDVNYVKKTSTLGLVNLLKYETYHISTLTHNFKEYLKHANRF